MSESMGRARRGERGEAGALSRRENQRAFDLGFVHQGCEPKGKRYPTHTHIHIHGRMSCRGEGWERGGVRSFTHRSLPLSHIHYPPSSKGSADSCDQEQEGKGEGGLVVGGTEPGKRSLDLKGPRKTWESWGMTCGDCR